MSTHTTQHQLDAQFQLLAEAYKRWGFLRPDERLGMNNGSKTYGRAYRLFVLKGDSGAHHNPPVGSDYLGMTKSEAYETLYTMRRTLEDALYMVKVRGARPEWIA